MGSLDTFGASFNAVYAGRGIPWTLDAPVQRKTARTGRSRQLRVTRVPGRLIAVGWWPLKAGVQHANPKFGQAQTTGEQAAGQLDGGNSAIRTS